MCKIKDQLNEVICGKVIRLWMIIVFLILLIVGVIILSLFLCTGKVFWDILCHVQLGYICYVMKHCIFVQPAEKTLNQYLQVKADHKNHISVPRVLIFIISFVSLVSHVLFAVIYEDPDENFDPSLFKVPLHLNGSFKLPNMVFTDELLTLSSNESQVLARHLEEKV